MAELQGKVIPVAIEDEVKVSYLNYAMSVIVSRALPDVRDGLKPVHRRILYAMNDMGLRFDRSYKKCGRIVGDVLGKYHPHGDQSIYDALVRLAQDFSLRYPVVLGQGNFGSVDGDPPAAMRYTEAKLQKIADEMLRDIKKETVDFGPNYDDSMTEPTVLPAAFPFLLANGASGIAVGMATNIAPHNITELCNAVAALIDEPEITIDGLIDYVKGPDFPTGGTIYGLSGIRKAFKTGRGKVVVRANFTMETFKNGKEAIIVHEIPYMVNKANLVTKIAELVRDKRIEGISDLRDESDRNGMRIVIELKKGVIPKVIINKLFTMTQMQSNFNVNALALHNGRPKLMNLKDMLQAFIEHRKEVIIRRTQFDLKKAEERAHILEGLKIALDNIDEVIAIIKSSKNVDDARTRLMDTFKLSEIQAQAILDMRLQKLTSLETQKIIDELNEILALIKYLKDLLASEQKILGVVKEETLAIAEKFGDERRTAIVRDEVESINIEDLIQKEDMVVLFSHNGYVKRIPVSAYRIQSRGGKGASSSGRLKEEDFIENMFVGSTHDYIMFISSAGQAYYLKVHEIPESSRQARGTSLKTLLQISQDEEIAAVVSVNDFVKDKYLFMATANGVVKKVPLSDFSNARTKGIIGVRLDEGDSVINAMVTNGDDDIVLVTKQGLSLRFTEDQVRAMGRASRGVRGINLQKGDELAGSVVVNNSENLFIISQFGFGKRCEYDAFTPHGRGTKGQIGFKLVEKSGEVAGILSIAEEDDLMVITSQGNTVKLKASDVSQYGKTATGVKVVDINKPDYVSSIDKVAKEDDDEDTEKAEITDAVEPAIENESDTDSEE